MFLNYWSLLIRYICKLMVFCENKKIVLGFLYFSFYVCICVSFLDQTINDGLEPQPSLTRARQLASTCTHTCFLFIYLFRKMTLSTGNPKLPCPVFFILFGKHVLQNLIFIYMGFYLIKRK